MKRLNHSLSAKLTLGVITVALMVYLITSGGLFLKSRALLRHEADVRAESVLNASVQMVRKHLSSDYPLQSVSLDSPYADGFFAVYDDAAKCLWISDSTASAALKPNYAIRQSIPDTKWTMELKSTKRSVYRNYYRMALFVVAINLLGVLLILILCRRGVHSALAPIWDLVGMSKLIADGKYNEYIPLSTREDAVGKLQNSFVAMQQSIREKLSEIRSTTDEITRHNKELEHATKMAGEALQMKNVFVTNVMHQIRTPLNIIQGFAQVLRDESELEPEEFESITTMLKHNTQHLNRMVLMLYDSSETGASADYVIPKEDNVSCNQVARECIGFTKERFPDMPIGFETKLDDSFTILTNHLYLMRTLRELLYNAAKYSDGQHVKVLVQKAKGVVKFIVEDVGPGISRSGQDMMYDFFAKQDDLSEGLGLGLPLSKRHAICLGGNLKYDTSYKRGARFVVTIPS